MHRHFQFDMREDPASDRRHDSRQLVQNLSEDMCVSEQGGTAPSTSNAHAAPPHTATGGERAPIMHDGPSRQAAALITSENGLAFESLISSTQAAKLLGNLHVKTLQRYARSGRLPGYQIGRHWYFRESELDAWLRLQLNSRCQSVR